MRAGIVAGGLHIPPPSWHMASARHSAGVVDLGPESPNRHVAIILRLRRLAPSGTAGAFNTVSIGGVPVAFTEVANGPAGRMVVGVAHVPENGLVTYTNEPHTGGRSEEYISIASYPGEITMVQSTGGGLWSESLSFSLNAVDGGVGLLVGDISGLDMPSDLEFFGTNGLREYAGWEHTTAPTWSKAVPRITNGVGIFYAATFALTGG